VYVIIYIIYIIAYLFILRYITLYNIYVYTYINQYAIFREHYTLSYLCNKYAVCFLGGRRTEVLKSVLTFTDTTYISHALKYFMSERIQVK
jgi:hypothetical protein